MPTTLDKAKRAIELLHDRVFDAKDTWNIHRHRLGTAHLFPGFGCQVCDAYAAIQADEARLCEYGCGRPKDDGHLHPDAILPSMWGDR